MPDPADRKVHAHPFKPHAQEANGDGVGYTPSDIPYAELAVTSNFSFLAGASHPDELVHQAASLGYRAIAVADHNTLAGVVRAHVAAKESGMPFIVGCRLRFAEPDWLSLLVYPTDRAAYGRLCRMLTVGKRRAVKGECQLVLEDIEANAEGLLAIALLEPHAFRAASASERSSTIIQRLAGTFDGDRLSLALIRLYGPDDQKHLNEITQLAQRTHVPLVAVNDVYYHVPERRMVQDVLTCIRHGCTLAEAGFRLFPNAERHLKPPQEMARLFAAYPQALQRTVEIAERARGFNLDQLQYEYPHEICPPDMTPMGYLKELTWEGAKERYPQGVTAKVRRQIEHEYVLIEELNYAPFFLTVHDLVRFARARGILCQGRGAAANSAVCFCLGVTSVDPDRIDVLFERFVSRERQEPPDIDVDFEHERREEVIQYIYEKYGRDRAGMTAEVITYRSRSAIRDVGKTLGLSLDAVDRIAKHVHDWADQGLSGDKIARLGFDPADRTLLLLAYVMNEILGFPRHLSQHVGGFVISRGPLCELVPIENAAMENRTVIEWDKDDIDALGMMKVDVLGLGMLTCIRKAMELIERHHQRPLTLASIPAEDPHVYDMICKADTLGVFQIESRAQMTMLPRLKPRCFYDLVIEVAIVRPGPIIGDMVHPFLRRRNGEEPVVYPDENIKKVLGKTLGIPLFQEQAMALAIVAAGFTPGEAEKLRRTISAWKSRSKDAIPRYRARFIAGMLGNGYEPAFAEQCFERLKGFSEYGFPESHAASFALLVYASSWLKCYYPAAFAAALLNSQPMGFYAPAQIVRDARDHGVQVRPVDVNHSDWDCTLEDDGRALRLGMRVVKGLREADARAIVQAVQRQRADGWHGSVRRPVRSDTSLRTDPCHPIIGDRPGGTHKSVFVRASSTKRTDKNRLVGATQDVTKQLLNTVSFTSIVDLWRASEVSANALYILALADAFGSMGLDRQRALWAVQSLQGRPLPLFDAPWREPESQPGTDRLPPPSMSGEVVRDYRTIGLSLKAHPMSFIRESLQKRRILTAAEIRDEQCCPHGRIAAVAGMVLFRQRPGTAKGVMFMTLEDETGRADLIVRPRIAQRFQTAAIYGQFIIARGRVERQSDVVHVLANYIEELAYQPGALPHLSRDFS